MKKYGILLGAGALLCALCLAGCSGQQEAYETQTYSVEAAQIEAIEIDVTDRKIAVAYSPDDEIHLTYYESSRQQYDIEAQDGVLTLRSADDKQWTDFIGGKPERTYRTITLELPRTLEASLSLKTTNEGLQLPALSLSGDLLVAVNQGGIEMEAVECGGDIQLEAKNGDIKGRLVGSYDDYTIISQAKKGENSLPESKDGGSHRLTVRTNNGDIQLALAAPENP